MIEIDVASQQDHTPRCPSPPKKLVCRKHFPISSIHRKIHLSEQFESPPNEAKPFRNPSWKHSLSGQGVGQNIITDFLFSF